MICGGGTGGHVYPALAVVQALRQRGVSNKQILWVGTHGQMEEALVPRADLTLQTIAGGPIAGVPRLTQLKNAMKLTASIGSSLRIIGRFQPDVLFLTGGYVNLPVAIAARMRGVKSAIYLPDVEPGAAIKRIQPLVQKIACTTHDSAAFLPEHKLVATGYPVRADLLSAREIGVEDARARFELTPDRPTLFVTGGSRGAQRINRVLMQILPQLLDRAQVIHISGTLTWDEVAANAATLSAEQRRYYRPYPYLHEEMGMAYRAADVVVARAGASTLGEGPAFGIPTILVPYPWAWRYQKVNADYLANRGAGVRVDDETMEAKLLETVELLLFSAERQATMKSAAAALAQPQAAENIADVLVELAGKN